MYKVPEISRLRLPQNFFINGGKITEIFDDSQLITDRFRQVKKWVKQLIATKFKDRTFPKSTGHCYVASAKKRYDLPHHGQWMLKECNTIIRDAGDWRYEYNSRLKHIQTIKSKGNILTPDEIYEMCGMPKYKQKNFKHLQGVTYTVDRIFVLFGSKDRRNIQVFICDRQSRLIISEKNFLYGDNKEKWMKWVKNWEAEGIAFDRATGELSFLVSYKTKLIYRYNRRIIVENLT